MFPDERKVKLQQEAQEGLSKGINILADAVSQTLGPNGRNVILERTYSKSKVTKDGVSVAREIFLEDRLANVGAQIAKEAALKTVEEAGDGTTTSTILMRALYNGIMSGKEKGYNVIKIKKVLLSILDNILETLEKESRKITTKKELQDIATLSANGDKELGNIIGELIFEIGKEGKIFIEENKTNKIDYKILKGSIIQHTFISPYMRNYYGDKAELNNPLIFISDIEFYHKEDLYPIVNIAVQNNRDLLIIAQEVDKDALTFILQNIQAGVLNCVIVRPPGVGNMRMLMLKDLEILLGGKSYTNREKNSLRISANSFGEAEKVIVGMNETLIINPKGEEGSIKERVEFIKTQIKEAPKGIDERHLERLALLFMGIGKIYIGGYTEIELKERKDRAEDAVLAAQSSYKKGYVPGGGSLFYRVGVKLLKSLEEETKNLTEEEKFAVEILANALQEPFRILSSNSSLGIEKSIELQNEYFDKKDYCIDFRNECIVNGVKNGIIDPVAVLESALKNAISTAILLATTDAVIYYKENIFNNAHIAHPDYGEKA